MPTTEVTINNKPLSTMGVAMLSGAYAALLTPPSLKEFVENDDPTQNGIDIIVPDSPVVNERDVTLTFLIKGTSQEAFLSNYADRKSTRLNSSHRGSSRMPSSA